MNDTLKNISTSSSAYEIKGAQRLWQLDKEICVNTQA